MVSESGRGGPPRQGRDRRLWRRFHAGRDVCVRRVSYIAKPPGRGESNNRHLNPLRKQALWLTETGCLL